MCVSVLECHRNVRAALSLSCEQSHAAHTSLRAYLPATSIQGDSARMSIEQNSEGGLDHAQPSWVEWEARLQPKRSSNTLLIVLAAVGAASVVAIAMRGLPSFHSSTPDAPTSQDRAPAQTSDAPAALQPRTSARREDRTERVNRIARCVSASGSVAYTDQPCRQGERADLVELRPDSNLADGMSVEARQASNSRSAFAAQQLAAHERRVAMNVTQASSECAQLDSLIAALDAAARLPQPGSEQDRLRHERKRARDRQFALRCG